MKENIERDIKILQKVLEEYIIADECGLSNNDFKDKINALSNVLSACRENRDQQKLIDKMKKFLLKENRMCDFLESEEYVNEEVNSLKKENEELEQPNLLYPDADEIYERYYKLKEENEELKEQNRYEWIRQHCLPQNLINKYYIPKDKIRDKIEELEREFDFYAGREHAEWQDGEFDGEQCNDISQQIKILKELLEEE